MKNKFIQTSRFFNLLSALLAFFLWGGWAYYINGGHGIYIRIISSLAQGTASSLITLFMIHVATYIFYKLFNSIMRMILPSVITVGFTGSCLVFMHYCIGTPNIFYTVTPALSVAFAFCLFTTFKLRYNMKRK
jgi:hypothetical protein